MLSTVLCLLCSAQATALIVQPRAQARVSAAVAPRTAAATMSDAKGPSNWQYVKGINDYGKEQTYMYLGSDGSGRKAVWWPFGDDVSQDSTLGLVWEKAYLIPLFAPGALAGLYVLAGGSPN